MKQTFVHRAASVNLGSLPTFSAPQDVPKLNRFCHRRKRPFLSGHPPESRPWRSRSESSLSPPSRHPHHPDECSPIGGASYPCKARTWTSPSTRACIASTAAC